MKFGVVAGIDDGHDIAGIDNPNKSRQKAGSAHTACQNQNHVVSVGGKNQSDSPQ